MVRVPMVLKAVPVVAASVAASVAAVWGLSRIAGWQFNPSVVAAISATLAAVAMRRGRGE